MKSCLIILIAFISLHGKAHGQYSNSQSLQPNALSLSWNYTSTSIIAELRATNANWILFGLQGQSFSSGTTDWVVAWLNKTTGIGHFSDRFSYISSSDLIQKDQQRDWTPLDAKFDGSDFVVKFSRSIVRCDESNQDVDIELGEMTAKFAMGSDFNVLSQSENISLTNNAQIVVSSMSLTLIPTSASSSVDLACPVPPPVPVFDSYPTGIYTNQAELIPYIYYIYWNFTQTSITGEVHVKTSGWVGFGLSPDGGMLNSDVFVGWITSDGHVNFTVSWNSSYYGIMELRL